MLASAGAAQSTSYQTIGGTTYGSDGTSYQRIWSATYGSDGATAQTIGRSTYINRPTGSRICQQIGSSVYCN